MDICLHFFEIYYHSYLVMGVYLSKLFGETNNHGKKSSKNSLSNSPKVENELCTPPNVYKKCADPRSATLGIQRTPIEVHFTNL